MKTIYAQDFELLTIDGGDYSYFSYEEPGHLELCIEPSTKGYDIALYDHNGILVGGRAQVFLTESSAGPTGVFDTAVQVANQMYKSHMRVAA